MRAIFTLIIAILFFNVASQGQCPVVNAGPDISICCGGTANLNGLATGASSVQWINVGASGGAFDNPALLNASFTPVAAECAVSFVVLELVVPGCPSSKDEITIFIHDMQQRLYTAPDQVLNPTVTDVTVSASHTIGGTYSGIWTTSGSGSFDDATSPNTIYHPSMVDKTNGNVTLVYTSLNACNYTQDDDMVVSFAMTTNTSDRLSQEDIKVYPSPSVAGIVSVELAGGTTIKELRVLNSLQSEIETERKIDGNGNKVTIDFSKLNPGIYYVWLTDGTRSGLSRIVLY